MECAGSDYGSNECQRGESLAKSPQRLTTFIHRGDSAYPLRPMKNSEARATSEPSAEVPPGNGGAASPFGDEDEFISLPRRQKLITMAGVMLALLLASLDQTIVSTALPSIVLDLGGFDRFTWITSAYLVASTTTVPIAGRLSDIYGRKWFFVIGISIFLVGSVLSGLSGSMNQLIAFRALQGIGGGVMMANAFTTVADLFPPAERGKWQGLLAGVFGVSSILGPLLGGVITDGLSWHWIFFVNIPLGIPILFLFIKYFPNTRLSNQPHKIDYLGIVLLIGAVVPLLIGLAWGGVQYPWASWQVISAISVGAVLMLVLIAWELKVDDPIIPLHIYRSRIVGLSLLAIFLTWMAMFGAIIFIPLSFQAVGRVCDKQRELFDPNDARDGDRSDHIRTAPFAAGRPLSLAGVGRVIGHDHRRGLSHDARRPHFPAGGDVIHRPARIRNGDHIPALYDCDSEHRGTALPRDRHLIHTVLPLDRGVSGVGVVRIVHDPALQRWPGKLFFAGRPSGP